MSSRPKDALPSWLYAFIALTALASLVSLSYRYRAEQKNRSVAIAVEYEALEELSSAQGLSLQAGMQELKRGGVNALVLSEEIAADLIVTGQVRLVSDGGATELRGPIEALRRIGRGIQTRYPSARFETSLAPEPLIKVFELPAALIRRMPIGLSPAEADLARSGGLVILARHSNPPAASSKTVSETIKWSASMGATGFLPQGDQVLGRRDSLDALVKALEESGMFYVTPEFSKIGGDAAVVQARPGLIVRLHSAQATELDKLPIQEAVDRYVRAARERSLRILLLRQATSSAPLPLTAFRDFAGMVKQGVEEGGYTIGRPHPFADPQVPRVLLLFIGLLAAPVCYWVGTVFVGSRVLRFVGGVLVFLLALACWFGTGRQAMALLGAIAFPTAAFIIADRRGGRSWPIELIVLSLVSFAGGLMVAGLLNGVEYYVRAEQFMGVKLAHFAPLALIGAYFSVRYLDVKKALASPVYWVQAGLALLILAGLGLMFTRTGNDNPAAVSDIELKLRYLLDTLLLVRPRTKEFLIGHPALVVALGALICTLRRQAPHAAGQGGLEKSDGKPRLAGWIPLLMMLGAIGQTSIVNTMAHLHTPLALNVSRLGVGLLAGGILGGILWAAIARLSPKEGS